MVSGSRVYYPIVSKRCILTFETKENGNLLEYVKEIVHVGFSNFLKKDVALSIYS